VPVVARGAGTGLSGGAMPHPDGVLLPLPALQPDPEHRIRWRDRRGAARRA